jgi:4-hydroxy-tetrahydrodipicolinate reductase
VRVCLFGVAGKVGAVLGQGLEQAGHEVVDGRAPGPAGCDVAVDFTRPDALLGNAQASFDAGVPLVVGTTGFDHDLLVTAAEHAGVACLVVPNFSRGALLMMRFAEEAGRVFGSAEIVELHADTKLDAPSGTARATAARIGGDVPIHSVRLPGLVAHQEVLFGGPGETLTIRHDTTSREAFVPGVLRAIELVRTLPPGVTVGLDELG